MKESESITALQLGLVSARWNDRDQKDQTEEFVTAMVDSQKKKDKQNQGQSRYICQQLQLAPANPNGHAENSTNLSKQHNAMFELVL